MANGNGKFVRWTAFTFIMILIFSVAIWYAERNDDILNRIADRVDSIDRRTSFLEGLSAGEQTTFKTEAIGILKRMYAK